MILRHLIRGWTHVTTTDTDTLATAVLTGLMTVLALIVLV